MLDSNIFEVLVLSHKDKKLTPLDFRILFYMSNKSSFLLRDLKEELNISSYSTLTKSIKNLIKNDYIVKETNPFKIQRGVSTYTFLVNTKKELLLKSSNNTINSLLDDVKSLVILFFELIPTNRKISKHYSYKAFELLILKNNLNKDYLIELVYFVASNDELKKIITRPTLLRENINLVIEKFNNIKNKV